MPQLLKRSLLIDTGFFVAIFSKSDRHHKKAMNLLPSLEKATWQTTWPVLTEACHMLDAYPPALDKLIKMCEDKVFEIFPLEARHASPIRKLMKKYSNLPMDLADASLVIAAEELDCGDIVSTDKRDFGVYRFKDHTPFRNLL